MAFQQSTSYVYTYTLIYTTQLKATASPLQHRHRARAPLKALKEILNKAQIQHHQPQAPKANSQIYTSQGRRKIICEPHLGPVNRILAKQQ
uniref:Uncharacterized protein n=1 Tax=Setaria viridis TaxID=4556 RepID=A0A4U6UWN5_SETVI|nr:hypothetical protein SEVIR_4G051600v2 [Setaria viridis]